MTTEANTPAAATETAKPLSVSAGLRAEAATFAKEDRDAFMAAMVQGAGVSQMMARRQWRKVHGSMYED